MKRVIEAILEEIPVNRKGTAKKRVLWSLGRITITLVRQLGVGAEWEWPAGSKGLRNIMIWNPGSSLTHQRVVSLS